MNEEIFGTNLYAYCGNNAVNDSDPNGYLSVSKLFSRLNVILSVTSKVLNFVSFVFSWLTPLGLIKNHRNKIVAISSVTVGISQFAMDFIKYKNKKSAGFRLAVYSFALCIIANIICYNFSKASCAKGYIKPFLNFLGTSFGVSIASYCWVFDIVLTMKSYSSIKKKIKRRVT